MNVYFFLSTSLFFANIHYLQLFQLKWIITDLWSRPTGETTLKKTRKVHYLIGGVETCAFYDDYNFLHRYISETVARRKKSINTFFIDNFMIYNFSLRYFYDKTYRFAENREKLIFLTFDLE